MLRVAALVPPVLILLGILCHAVLEGLTIGLQVCRAEAPGPILCRRLFASRAGSHRRFHTASWFKQLAGAPPSYANAKGRAVLVGLNLASTPATRGASLQSLLLFCDCLLAPRYGCQFRFRAGPAWCPEPLLLVPNTSLLEYDRPAVVPRLLHCPAQAVSSGRTWGQAAMLWLFLARPFTSCADTGVMSMRLQQDYGGVVSAFVAMASHKWVESIAVAAAFVAAGSSLLSVVRPPPGHPLCRMVSSVHQWHFGLQTKLVFPPAASKSRSFSVPFE